jgi:hypothetical protein
MADSGLAFDLLLLLSKVWQTLKSFANLRRRNRTFQMSH